MGDCEVDQGCVHMVEKVRYHDTYGHKESLSPIESSRITPSLSNPNIKGEWIYYKLGFSLCV